uniref:Neurobeachin-like protein 2 n=1 Tax=Eptatretus burgeri TaxID=7764 RepID=A0A8C4NEY2_EPTBU
MRLLSDTREGSSPRLRLILLCLTEVIQALHTSSPDRRQVEVSTVLDGYLKVLNATGVGDALQDLQVQMLKTIPEMLACTDRPTLQASFLNSNCFEHLLRLLQNSKGETGGGDTLVVLTIRVLSEVMLRSPAAKEVFKERIGYPQLLEVLQSLGQPSKDLLDEILNMAVEGDHTSSERRGIANVQLLLLLLRWLPGLASRELQASLAASLLRLCTCDKRSRIVCVTAGMLSCTLDTLENPEILQHPVCAQSLIKFLEAIGSHSVREEELFRVFRLIRVDNLPSDTQTSSHVTAATMETSPNMDSNVASKFGSPAIISRPPTSHSCIESLDEESTTRPHVGPGHSLAHPFAPMLTRALLSMARRDGKESALQYFDLTHEMSGITVPAIERWPGNGFSFHTWLCLEPDQPRGVGLLRRRQLYSFFTSSGMGFEAFFTATGVLAVAVCTKKEHVTVTLPDSIFQDGNWHCVAVVHTASRRTLFFQNVVNIYVDGQLKQTAQLKFPPLNEPFTSCCIGSAGNRTITPSPSQIPEISVPSVPTGQLAGLSISPSRPSVLPGLTPGRPATSADVRTIPAGTQDGEWGSPSSLRGQLGTVFVFHDTLQLVHLKALHRAGPNNHFPFRAPEVELLDLPSKMLLHYTPKACHNLMCLDLAPSQLFDGRLTGKTVVNWDVKDVINCIGGVQVLLPLLEQLRSIGPESSLKQDYATEGSPIRSFELRLEKNHVACFILMIKNFIKGHLINQDTLAQGQGLAMIGALLQQVNIFHVPTCTCLKFLLSPFLHFKFFINL